MSPEPEPVLIGRRLADDIDPFANRMRQPGDYWRYRGVWYCMTPSGDVGSLREHEVTEHDDGAITVSPSISCSRAPALGTDGKIQVWHGFLQRGVWRLV